MRRNKSNIQFSQIKASEILLQAGHSTGCFTNTTAYITYVVFVLFLFEVNFRKEHDHVLSPNYFWKDCGLPDQKIYSVNNNKISWEKLVMTNQRFGWIQFHFVFCAVSAAQSGYNLHHSCWYIIIQTNPDSINNPIGLMLHRVNVYSTAVMLKPPEQGSDSCKKKKKMSLHRRDKKEEERFNSDYHTYIYFCWSCKVENTFSIFNNSRFFHYFIQRFLCRTRHIFLLTLKVDILPLKGAEKARCWVLKLSLNNRVSNVFVILQLISGKT